MGAWGYGVLEEDSAYDVMEELTAAQDAAGYLEKAFDEAISSNSSIYKDGAVSEPVCLGFDEGVAASVCGAVLDAILNGTEYSDDSGEFSDLISSLKTIHCEHLKPKAVKALKRLISDDSDLNEIWKSNTESYPEWKALYTNMIKRLSA